MKVTKKQAKKKQTAMTTNTAALPLRKDGKPRGRPGPKPWMPPDLAQVETLASRQADKEDIAAALGISKDTMARRERSLADFAAAIERGRARGRIHAGKRVFEIMDGPDHGAALKAALVVLNKPNMGWSPTQKVELSTPPEGTTINVRPSLTEQEAAGYATAITNALRREREAELACPNGSEQPVDQAETDTKAG